VQALVVDSDRYVRDTLTDALARDGYEVLTAGTGEEALARVAEHTPDAMLLERHLPDVDGCEVCRRLRRLPDDIRIVMFSYACGADERVRGLEAGADVFMSKPLVTAEVMARLRAFFRRAEPVETPLPLSWGGVRLDPTLYAIAADRAHRELTPTEYRLLELFMHNPERVLSHAEIGESVWGTESPHATTLWVYIGYIRRKMRECGAGQLIHTVPGQGYVLREAA
jgi:two-component system, OmpR family, response regulator MprA